MRGRVQVHSVQAPGTSTCSARQPSGRTFCAQLSAVSALMAEINDQYATLLLQGGILPLPRNSAFCFCLCRGIMLSVSAQFCPILPAFYIKGRERDIRGDSVHKLNCRCYSVLCRPTRLLCGAFRVKAL